MPPLLAEIAIPLVMSFIGLALGLWLRRPTGEETQQEKVLADRERETREVIGRLSELAARVAADVGEHNTRVQEINSELEQAEGQPKTDVVFSSISRLIEANEKMQAELASAEGRLQEQARVIETHVAEARTDALTLVANRRAFDDEMFRRSAEYARHGRPVSVVMIDVDFFKKFNDAHGHQAGDEVLRKVAKALQQTARKMDVVARYGGEEFALVFPGTPIEDGQRGAERSRAAIEAITVNFEGKQLKVTASCGVAQLLPGEDASTLVKRADECLYESKKAGRNCVHWHDGQEIHPLPKSALVARQSTRPATPPPKPAAEAAPVVDPLAALSTRTQFCADVHRRLAEWKRGGATLSVLLVSIDRLGQLVQERSQQAGDLAKQLVAKFLLASMRDMDHVAKYDGETFGLLLPAAQLEHAMQIAERLRIAVSRCKLLLHGRPLTVTVSAGVAEAIQSDDSSQLLQRAEQASHAAPGGNATYLHNGTKPELVQLAEETA